MGKRGPRAGTEKRGAPTGIRFDPALKARLAEAARSSGRTFSEEVSARLDASFGTLEFRDPETKSLFALIGYAMELIAHRTGKRWFEDPWTFEHCEIATRDILSFLRPLGPPVVPDDAYALRSLVTAGLHNLIPQAKASLSETPIGLESGKEVISMIEAIAEGRENDVSWIVDAVTGAAYLTETWDQLRPIADIVKARLIALDADGQAELELRAGRSRRGPEAKQ